MSVNPRQLGTRAAATAAIIVCLVASSCQSTPHVIELKDGRSIETTNLPVLDEKTGYYRFRCNDNCDHMVNAEEIVQFAPR